MIPHIIHYCWFGGSPLPKSALRCIESWRKFLQDFEIKEWNESNFDTSICPYVKEAYEQRMYAFVSDYARFWILYHYGGIYFDTDVEIVKDMRAIINKGAFMGIEKSLATNGTDHTAEIGVAPGLGVGAEARMPFVAELLKHYESIVFDPTQGTVVYHTTHLLKNYGLANENAIQNVAGFTIYPDSVFCPMDSTTGIITITPDTVAIHHYACSWMDHNTLSFQLHLLKNRLIRLLGPKIVLKCARIFK